MYRGYKKAPLFRKRYSKKQFLKRWQVFEHDRQYDDKQGDKSEKNNRVYDFFRF